MSVRPERDGEADPARPTRRSGRRPGSPDTRGRILATARGSFSEHGFDGASIRAIAAEAGVDPALIHHYFGTKQRLFVAAMEPPFDLAAGIATVFAGPMEGVGERLVRFVLEQWDVPATRDMILGLVRSATTDPVAAAMLRELIRTGPLLAIAASTPAGDAELRASLVGSQLVGLAMARYIVGVEPLASASPDLLARIYGPVVERYLVAELDGSDDRR